MSNNRFWNSRNPNQGDFKKVLCVCSAGLLRSPTIAWILSNEPFNFNTRAVGSSPSFALTPIDEVFIEWADIIVFVSPENETDVTSRFDISKKQVVVLNLPDVFQFRDPTLVKIATRQLTEMFDQLDEQQQQLDSETDQTPG